MTNSERKLRWLSISVLSTCLGVVGACGDDGGDGEEQEVRDAGSSVDSGTRDTGSPVVDTGTRPADAGSGSAPSACLDDVYEELDQECKTCVCTANAEAAPSCDGPCWEFLACTAVANAGRCAEFALGTQENGACIQMVCGKELATGGAGPKASALSAAGITRACLPTAPGATTACSASLTSIRPAL